MIIRNGIPIEITHIVNNLGFTLESSITINGKKRFITKEEVEDLKQFFKGLQESEE